MQGFDTDNPVDHRGGDDGNIAAKLVLFVHLALGDAFHLGGMQTVQLVLVIALLIKKPLCAAQQIKPLPKMNSTYT